MSDIWPIMVNPKGTNGHDDECEDWDHTVAKIEMDWYPEYFTRSGGCGIVLSSLSSCCYRIPMTHGKIPSIEVTVNPNTPSSYLLGGSVLSGWRVSVVQVQFLYKISYPGDGTGQRTY